MNPADTSAIPRKTAQVLDAEISMKPVLTSPTTEHSRAATKSLPYRLIFAPRRRRWNGLLVWEPPVIGITVTEDAMGVPV
jgi:hypothetical protein